MAVMFLLQVSHVGGGSFGLVVMDEPNFNLDLAAIRDQQLYNRK